MNLKQDHSHLTRNRITSACSRTKSRLRRHFAADAGVGRMKQLTMAVSVLIVPTVSSGAGPAGEIVSLPCSQAIASAINFIEDENLQAVLTVKDGEFVCVGQPMVDSFYEFKRPTWTRALKSTTSVSIQIVMMSLVIHFHVSPPNKQFQSDAQTAARFGSPFALLAHGAAELRRCTANL